MPQAPGRRPSAGRRRADPSGDTATVLEGRMEHERLSERETVLLIREMIGAPAPGVRVGPGDDAAVFDFADSGVVLTIDAIFEGVHFSLDTHGYSDVGWKAMASSISDIAAMGGQAACAMLSLSFGGPPGREDVEALMAGALEAASRYNCPIVGGDVSSSRSCMGVTAMVAGCRGHAGVVLRSTAREGDLIGVTGELGDSAAGLAVLQSGSEELREKYPALVEAHLRPRPRLREGEVLASCGVTSMEDVSDGLAADLDNICRASGVGCEVRAADIPVGPEARELASTLGVDPLGWALGGGEDYELLFTAPPGRFAEVVGTLAGYGMPASEVGVVTPACSGSKVVAVDGTESGLEGGYDHFLRT